MIIPENTLYNFIKSCLQLMRTDFDANITDETKTILYQLFHVDDNNDLLKFETYDYYTQAKNLFTRKVEQQRQLDVNISYNLERSKIPTIHILLPSENRGRFDSIGDQSSVDNTYDVTNQVVAVTKETTYNPMYSLMISSDNSSEVLLTYYWLRAMFIIYKEHLEFKGLQNLKLSGADIVFQQDLAPNNVYHRNINVDFDYASQFKVNIPMKLSGNIGLTICADIGDEFNKLLNQP